MARPKPVLAKLCDLTPGQYADCFALLAEKTKGKTREGKDYYVCRFRDNRRTATFMAWSDGAHFQAVETDWHAGQFYKLRVVYAEHERYGPQFYELIDLRPVNEADKAQGFDPGQLVESSRFDPALMLAELQTLVTEHIADEPLRGLVLGLLAAHAGPFQRLPATRDRFYPFAGGLVEHTLSVTKSCLNLVDRYRAYYSELTPPLNKDLVIAGAALHDIGRVLEFTDDLLAPTHTIPGRLSGHLVLGRDLLRDAARVQGDVHPELVLLLEHILLTHLALPEWGSPRLPLAPECLIVHHADDLDAKMEMYARCLSRDRSEGPFTDRDPGLGRQLLKGRTV
jgi:3'-5' exoribonuclease